jgi:hypothetical protein
MVTITGTARMPRATRRPSRDDIAQVRDLGRERDQRGEQHEREEHTDDLHRPPPVGDDEVEGKQRHREPQDRAHLGQHRPPPHPGHREEQEHGEE